MKIQTYIMALALLGTIMGSLSVGNYLVYSSTDDDDDNDDDENQPCYSVCGNTGNSHAYYEGFISGCISSGGGDYFACDSKSDR